MQLFSQFIKHVDLQSKNCLSSAWTTDQSAHAPQIARVDKTAFSGVDVLRWFWARGAGVGVGGFVVYENSGGKFYPC